MPRHQDRLTPMESLNLIGRIRTTVLLIVSNLSLCPRRNTGHDESTVYEAIIILQHHQMGTNLHQQHMNHKEVPQVSKTCLSAAVLSHRIRSHQISKGTLTNRLHLCQSLPSSHTTGKVRHHIIPLSRLTKPMDHWYLVEPMLNLP